MNNAKITVPSAVAAAIRHYTDLADTKSEAFVDILTMGYEGSRSETILRHFDGNHDELMEALICGYQTPEDKVRELYNELQENVRVHREYNLGGAEKFIFATYTVKNTLNIFGIKIEGVNA